jgi:hypothetical protein
MPVAPEHSEFKLRKVDIGGKMLTKVSEEEIDYPRKIVRFIRRDDDVTVTVQLFGKAHLAILDSGASCCLVRRDLVVGVVLDVCRLQLVDAQNHRIAVSGKCVLDVQMGDLTIAQEFVVADIDNTILLGSDFLFKNHCVIDFCRLCLVVNGVTVQFSVPCCREVANVCRAEACRCPRCAAAGQLESCARVVGSREQDTPCNERRGTDECTVLGDHGRVVGGLRKQDTPCNEARSTEGCLALGAHVCTRAECPESVRAEVASFAAVSERDKCAESGCTVVEAIVPVCNSV